MKKINWNGVQETANVGQPGPGGYECKVISVTDDPVKECLCVLMDITTGEFAGRGAAIMDKLGKDWGYIRMYRSYKPTAQGFFKHFLSALEKSNPRRFDIKNWDNDEHKLETLEIGIVLSGEEYIKNDGNTGLRMVVTDTVSTEDIRKANFKVRPLKRLDETSIPAQAPAAPAAPVYDDDCPF